MDLKCLKCGGTALIKNGVVFGWQRWKCKSCGYQFTKVAPAGKPLFLKLISHSLFMSGLSMRQIAKILGVTAQSVSRWIRKWHPAYMLKLGNKEKLTSATKDTLMPILNIQKNDRLLVSSTRLPSGAVYHIVIQLPDTKTLKK